MCGRSLQVFLIYMRSDGQLDHLGMDLLAIVSFHMGADNQPRSSSRAARTHNH